MKPIAILNNGPLRREKQAFLAACGGDHDAVFGRAASLPASAFADFDIEGGSDLPDPAHFSGVILTGSAAMVTDRHPWAERQAAWVRQHRDRLPMLGVCFGHQLLTHALGGEVGWTPSGPEYGTVEITLQPAAASDRLFGGLGTSLRAQAAHSQSALRLPDDAVLLASGASGIQAARFGTVTWGIQFHPEFDPAIMRGLFSAYRDQYAEIGLDVAAIERELTETPGATGIVRKFIEICRAAAPLTAWAADSQPLAAI